MESQINNTDYDPSARYGVPILLRTLDTAGASLNDVIKFNGTRWVAGPGGSSAWSSITGTPNEVAYFDASGNGTSDSNFTRDSSTYVTYMLMPQNSGVDIAGVATDNDIFGLPGTNGVAMRRGDVAEAVGSTVIAIIDGTPLGAPSAYVGFFNSTDLVTNAQTLMYFFPENLGVSVDDGTTYRSKMSFRPDSVSFRADNNFGGGNDTAGFIADVNGGGGSQYARMYASQSGPGDYGIEVTTDRVTVDFGAFNRSPGSFFDLASAPTMDGQVLTGYVNGSTAWTIPSATASLTATQIGYGDGSNILTGTSNWTYDDVFSNVIQKLPLNSDVLSWSGWGFTGGGLNDIHIDNTYYDSKKYGGNLTITVDTSGTPDTFNWVYTGSWSEIIGQGTGVSMSTTPMNINDDQGHTIATIYWDSDTGHTPGDYWTRASSLSVSPKGYNVSDTGGHTFMRADPTIGYYLFGDGQNLLAWGGNGTRIEVIDENAELDLFAARYFRIENPISGDTAVLADMQSGIFNIGTNNLVVKDIGFSATYMSINPPSSVGGFGDWSNLGTGATVAVDWSAGSTVTLTGNSSNGTQFFVNGNTQEIKGRVDGHFKIVDVTNAISAIDLDTVNKNGSFGWVSGTGVNGNYLYIDDANHDSRIVTDSVGYFSVKGGSNILFQTNASAQTIVTGDVSSSINGSKATVDIANKQFKFTTGGTDRFIAYEDWTFIGGAVVHGSIQTYTSTGSVSINDNVSTLQYNPASVNATATITLPATSGGSGSIVTIVFGGTVTSGNPVVTALTIAPGSGNTIVDSNVPTTANAGDALVYQKIGSYWYRVK